MGRITETARDMILTITGFSHIALPEELLVMHICIVLALYLQGENADKLEHVTIDYVGRDGETGFDIRNPGIKPLGGEPPTGPLAERVAKVIEDQVNPGVASHGGKITLVDVRDDVAFITMS